MHMQFGLLDDGKVRLQQFYPDPDVNNATWFKATGETIGLAGRSEVTEKNKTHRGNCYDTGEYVSKIGEMMKALLQEAPESASLVVFDYSTGAGTRTFKEEVNAKYYE